MAQYLNYTEQTSDKMQQQQQRHCARTDTVTLTLQVQCTPGQGPMFVSVQATG
jgi:hypothetical protein